MTPSMDAGPLGEIVPEFDADAKYLCDRLKVAADDYTSLGRWGWGIAIGFLTQIFFETAKAKGNLFAPLACGGDVEDIAQGLLAVIVIAGLAYGYFLWDAMRKVINARTAVYAMNALGSTPALRFAVENAPSQFDLIRALVMRALIFLLLFFVWFLLFEVYKSKDELQVGKDGLPSECAGWKAVKKSG